MVIGTGGLVKRIVLTLPALVIVACAASYNPLEAYKEVSSSTITKLPEPEAKPNEESNPVSQDPANKYDQVQVTRGKYLVGLLGCASCHTNGALIGQPEQEKVLAGSRVGIAFSNPLQEKYPGIVYPANLTPDNETGLGLWQDKEIEKAIRMGIDRHGRMQLPIMPWQVYTNINSEDAEAIVAYLRSLPPIRHRVPEQIMPGQKSDNAYVHFGIYQKK